MAGKRQHHTAGAAANWLIAILRSAWARASCVRALIIVVCRWNSRNTVVVPTWNFRCSLAYTSAANRCASAAASP